MFVKGRKKERGLNKRSKQRGEGERKKTGTTGMSKFKVQRFDPSTLKPHRIIIVVGKRGTGKSVLLRDLLYHISKRVDFGLGMTPTEESAEMMRSHMPDSWIYSSFSASKLDHMLNVQRELVKKKAQRSLFVVMDDCMYDKKVLKGVGIRDLFMNGRHLNVTLLNAVQYVMDMGPDLRTQVDYVFALRENIMCNKSKLWKYFFGMFDRYDDFCKVMDKCTEDHGCIVMDNTRGTSLSDSIFWYRADIDLPPFRMGKEVYWKLSDRYRRSQKEIDDMEDELDVLDSVKEKKDAKRISVVHCEEAARLLHL